VHSFLAVTRLRYDSPMTGRGWQSFVRSTIASCALFGCATADSPAGSPKEHEERRINNPSQAGSPESPKDDEERRINDPSPAGSPEDHEERRINDRSFEVKGHARGDKNRSRAAHAAMRRAAELTVANGMDGFTILADGQPPITCTTQGEGTARSTTCSLGSGKVVLPSADIVIYMLNSEEGLAAIARGHTVYDAGRILGGVPRISRERRHDPAEAK
jgi:hypothetical protein